MGRMHMRPKDVERPVSQFDRKPQQNPKHRAMQPRAGILLALEIPRFFGLAGHMRVRRIPRLSNSPGDLVDGGLRWIEGDRSAAAGKVHIAGTDTRQGASGL